MSSLPLPFHAHTPRTLLVERFAHIAATRMAGLPMVNPALAVGVPAMHEWEGEWIGVLVTPWAINLVLLPGPGGRFRPIEVGGAQHWHFPSGRYEFLGNREDGLGHYQTCSLASPTFDFPTQTAAEEFALAAFDALLTEAAPAASGGIAAAAEHARLAGQPVTARPVSRRAFLGGNLFGDGR